MFISEVVLKSQNDCHVKNNNYGSLDEIQMVFPGDYIHIFFFSKVYLRSPYNTSSNLI